MMSDFTDDDVTAWLRPLLTCKCEPYDGGLDWVNAQECPLHGAWEATAMAVASAMKERWESEHAEAWNRAVFDSTAYQQGRKDALRQVADLLKRACVVGEVTDD